MSDPIENPGNVINCWLKLLNDLEERVHEFSNFSHHLVQAAAFASERLSVRNVTC
jgi:hypothetical protein